MISLNIVVRLIFLAPEWLYEPTNCLLLFIYNSESQKNLFGASTKMLPPGNQIIFNKDQQIVVNLALGWSRFLGFWVYLVYIHIIWIMYMSIDLIWILESELFTIHGQLDNFVFIFEKIKIYWRFQTKMFTMLLNSPNFVVVEMVIWNVTIDITL